MFINYSNYIILINFIYIATTKKEHKTYKSNLKKEPKKCVLRGTIRMMSKEDTKYCKTKTLF